eukprot:4434319-Pleurochrysis_carterae.AAC.1
MAKSQAAGVRGGDGGADDSAKAAAEAAVPNGDPIWNAFAARGDATFLLEEIHDGCDDIGSRGTSAAAKLYSARLPADRMPQHQPWQIFCQPQLRPCCHDVNSFLNPGRRQCVNGADLSVEMLAYVSRIFDMYRGPVEQGSDGEPRSRGPATVGGSTLSSANGSASEGDRSSAVGDAAATGARLGSERGTHSARGGRRRVMGLLNLMSAHEHFMTRLAALDEHLLAFLKRFAPRLTEDTALMLLADHGTHGIWYNDFAIGEAEHRSPALLLSLPAKFVDAHPTIDGALRRNQLRRVTPFDLHATMRHLAAWPAMPSPSVEASSLFIDLTDERSCEAARIPAEWCLEPPASCFRESAHAASLVYTLLLRSLVSPLFAEARSLCFGRIVQIHSPLSSSLVKSQVVGIRPASCYGDYWQSAFKLQTAHAQGATQTLHFGSKLPGNDSDAECCQKQTRSLKGGTAILVEPICYTALSTTYHH